MHGAGQALQEAAVAAGHGLVSECDRHGQFLDKSESLVMTSVTQQTSVSVACYHLTINTGIGYLFIELGARLTLTGADENIPTN